jgi:hypothetical protein
LNARLFTKPCASFSFSSDPWSFFAAKHPRSLCVAGISFIRRGSQREKYKVSCRDADNAAARYIQVQGTRNHTSLPVLSIFLNGGAFFTIFTAEKMQPGRGRYE